MRQFPNPTDLPPTNVSVYLSMGHFEHTYNEILTMTNDDNDFTSLSDPSVANPSSPPTKKHKKDKKVASISRPNNNNNFLHYSPDSLPCSMVN